MQRDDDLSLSAVHGLASLALSKAEAAEFKVEAHEDLCAERYKRLEDSISTVRDAVQTILKIIGWGGSLLATVLIGLAAYFGARSMTNNDTQLQTLQAQILANSRRLETQGLQGVQGVQGIQGEKGDQGARGPEKFTPQP